MASGVWWGFTSKWLLWQRHYYGKPCSFRWVMIGFIDEDIRMVLHECIDQIAVVLSSSWRCDSLWSRLYIWDQITTAKQHFCTRSVTVKMCWIGKHANEAIYTPIIRSPIKQECSSLSLSSYLFWYFIFSYHSTLREYCTYIWSSSFHCPQHLTMCQ